MSSPYDNLASPGDKPVDANNKGGTMGKGLLRSKTMWVNLITTVVGFGTWISGSEIIADRPEVVAGVATALGVLNMILRLLTKEPITSVK
jgi:hypothetical protein